MSLPRALRTSKRLETEIKTEKDGNEYFDFGKTRFFLG